MSALKTLVQSMSSFDGVKALLEVAPYFFNISDDEHLYMVSFTEKSDLSTKIAREANGVIFEKETNKLVHYLFEKCYEGITEENYSQEDDKLPKALFNPDKMVTELFFEGTVIKLFYYNSEWRTATSRCLDASKTTWSSKRSFHELFVEAISTIYNTTYEEFLGYQEKEKFCYSFLIQHPENKMVVNVETPTVFYLNIVDLETLSEYKPDRENLLVDKTFDELVALDKSVCQNYMIFQLGENDEVLYRIKYQNPEFLQRKKLFGNYPNIGLRYIEFLGNSEQQYLLRKNFSDNIKTFNLIDKLFFTTCKRIHGHYIKNYIKKEPATDIPESYTKTITQLHGQYRRTRQFITREDVSNKLMSIGVPRIVAHIIGFRY
jgi:hypothetical protein